MEYIISMLFVILFAAVAYSAGFDMCMTMGPVKSSLRLEGATCPTFDDAVSTMQAGGQIQAGASVTEGACAGLTDKCYMEEGSVNDLPAGCCMSMAIANPMPGVATCDSMQMSDSEVMKCPGSGASGSGSGSGASGSGSGSGASGSGSGSGASGSGASGSGSGSSSSGSGSNNSGSGSGETGKCGTDVMMAFLGLPAMGTAAGGDCTAFEKMMTDSMQGKEPEQKSEMESLKMMCGCVGKISDNDLKQFDCLDENGENMYENMKHCGSMPSGSGSGSGSVPGNQCGAAFAVALAGVPAMGKAAGGECTAFEKMMADSVQGKDKTPGMEKMKMMCDCMGKIPKDDLQALDCEDDTGNNMLGNLRMCDKQGCLNMMTKIEPEMEKSEKTALKDACGKDTIGCDCFQEVQKLYGDNKTFAADNKDCKNFDKVAEKDRSKSLLELYNACPGVTKLTDDGADKIETTEKSGVLALAVFVFGIFAVLL